MVRASSPRPARPPRARLRRDLPRPSPSAITVAPDSEREVCQLVTLRNRKAMDASEITMAMPSGATYTSHHFAIFLYDDAAPLPPVRGCFGGGGVLVCPFQSLRGSRRVSRGSAA